MWCSQVDTEKRKPCLQNSENEIIAAAIEGFESQKQRIDGQIAELRQMLDGDLVEPTATPEAPTGKRKKFRAATRRRMKEPNNGVRQRSKASLRHEQILPTSFWRAHARHISLRCSIHTISTRLGLRYSSIGHDPYQAT